MSWETPFLDEASSSAFSSKIAKEKNNSTTMQAHTDNSNGRSCSEKDSGFSDTSSDCKHTDAKDPSNEKRQRETSKETFLNHNESLEISNRRNVIVAPGTQQLPPFYIIKNMVQSHIVQKNAPLIWPSGAKPAVSGENPVILLQPPTPQFPKAPGLSQSDITAKKINAAHLPVKSYPRIAPYPSKKPADKTTQNSNALNQSKRVCIENNNAQATHKVVPSTSRLSSCSATVSATQPTHQCPLSPPLN
uniref:Uncharacterized protein n=1 Tax=Neogobius melanostomus TaxID=47308 RepID=A0A8C6SZG3_9GOBI